MFTPRRRAPAIGAGHRQCSKKSPKEKNICIYYQACEEAEVVAVKTASAAWGHQSGELPGWDQLRASQLSPVAVKHLPGVQCKDETTSK